MTSATNGTDLPISRENLGAGELRYPEISHSDRSMATSCYDARVSDGRACVLVGPPDSGQRFGGRLGSKAVGRDSPRLF